MAVPALDLFARSRVRTLVVCLVLVLFTHPPITVSAEGCVYSVTGAGLSPQTTQFPFFLGSMLLETDPNTLVLARVRIASDDVASFGAAITSRVYMTNGSFYEFYEVQSHTGPLHHADGIFYEHTVIPAVNMTAGNPLLMFGFNLPTGADVYQGGTQVSEPPLCPATGLGRFEENGTALPPFYDRFPSIWATNDFFQVSFVLENATCGPLALFPNQTLSDPRALLGGVPPRVTISTACPPGTPGSPTPNVTCLATGVWSAPLEGCACPAIPGAVNGSWSSLEGTPGATRTLTCDTGYEVTGGAATTTCTGGAWAPAYGACTPVQCGAIAPPTNGTASLTSAEYPDVVTFTCNTGFTMAGQSSIACTSAGTFSGPPPVCNIVTCPGYSVDDATPVACPSNEYLRSCEWACNGNLTLVGDAVRTCTANGTWTGTEPICTDVDCGACPVLEPNSTVSLPDGGTFYTQRCLQSCNAGFSGFGAATRTCEITGAWSATSFVCRRDCTAYGPPTDGTLGPACASVRYGTVCDASCNRGYGPLQGSATRTCGGTVEGVWTGAAPSACPIVDCGVLRLNGSVSGGASAHGTVNCAAGTTYGAVCSVACDPGRVVNGNRTRDALSVVCDATPDAVGFWGDGTPLACLWCPETTVWVAPGERVGGVVCADCPQGGVCPGGLVEPYAQPGWFRLPTGQFQRCVPASSCLGRNLCLSGHEGTACQACVGGYIRKDNGECEKCNSATVYLVFGLLLFLILIGILLFRLAKKATAYFASLSVAFNFFQILAILGSFDLKWPGFVRSFLNVFQFFNFNVSIINPKCAVSGGGNSAFLIVFYGKLLLPMLAFLLFLIGVACVWLYHALYMRCLYDEDADKVAAARNQERTSSWVPTMSRPEALESTWMMVNAFLSFLALIYLLVTASSMDVFACTRQLDGRRTLNAEASVDCDSGTYQMMLAATIISLVVFSAGLPLLLTAVLAVHRFDLWRYRTIALFGLLYQRYERKYYFFEVLVLLRRFGFVFGRILFPHSPLGQALVALLAVIVATITQLWLQPYRSPTVNWLETMCMGFGVVCVIFGVVYVTTADEMSSGTRDGFGTVLVIIICASVLVIVVAITSEIKRQYRLKSHGVEGGYASDTLTAYPAFFERDTYILENTRVRDTNTTLYRIALETPEPVEMSGLLVVHSLLRNTSCEPWWHRLLPTSYAADKPAAIAHVESSVRHTASPDLRQHHFALILNQPAHYVFSVQLLDAANPRTPDAASLEGGPSRPASIDLIDFWLSTETGSLATQSFALPVQPTFGDRGCRLYAPSQRLLITSTNYAFELDIPDATHAAIAAQRPVHSSSGTTLTRNDDGRWVAVFSSFVPGDFAVWADFSLAGAASVSAPSDRRVSVSVTDFDFVPIVWFTVVDETGDESILMSRHRGRLGSLRARGSLSNRDSVSLSDWDVEMSDYGTSDIVDISQVPASRLSGGSRLSGCDGGDGGDGGDGVGRDDANGVGVGGGELAMAPVPVPASAPTPALPPAPASAPTPTLPPAPAPALPPAPAPAPAVPVIAIPPSVAAGIPSPSTPPPPPPTATPLPPSVMAAPPPPPSVMAAPPPPPPSVVAPPPPSVVAPPPPAFAATPPFPPTVP